MAARPRYQNFVSISCLDGVFYGLCIGSSKQSRSFSKFDRIDVGCLGHNLRLLDRRIQTLNIPVLLHLVRGREFVCCAKSKMLFRALKSNKFSFSLSMNDISQRIVLNLNIFKSLTMSVYFSFEMEIILK